MAATSVQRQYSSDDRRRAHMWFVVTERQFHRDVLRGVMDVFLAEPLLDWRKEAMPTRTTKLGLPLLQVSLSRV